MHYVEVFYLTKMVVTNRKFQEYEEKEAQVMFRRTIGKLKSENKSALICVRDEEHVLLNSELIK